MRQHCAFCGHRHLTAKAARYIHQQGDEMLIVEDLPGLECDCCREQYLDAAVLKTIEAEHTAILHRGKKPQAVKPVAVESFRVQAG